jgi:hypothetical protein
LEKLFSFFHEANISVKSKVDEGTALKYILNDVKNRINNLPTYLPNIN